MTSNTDNPKLYLIPCNLSESPLQQVLPSYVLESIITQTKVFMVENLRTARRFLKQVDRSINIDELHFCEIGKKQSQQEMASFFKQHIVSQHIGVLSEAGCPGIADPGAEIVALAHRECVQVVPLVGPSSILLALMATGMNGQNFAFNGYLPVKPNERASAIKKHELLSQKEKQTQLFIETPYRNDKLLEAFCQHCRPSTLLGIACNLTAEDEYIRTQTIAKWKQTDIELGKRPTLFVLMAT